MDDISGNDLPFERGWTCYSRYDLDHIHGARHAPGVITDIKSEVRDGVMQDELLYVVRWQGQTKDSPLLWLPDELRHPSLYVEMIPVLNQRLALDRVMSDQEFNAVLDRNVARPNPVIVTKRRRPHPASPRARRT